MEAAQDPMDKLRWGCLASFLLAMLVGLIVGIRYGRKHERAMRQLAQSQGWGFARGIETDVEVYEAKLRELFPNRKCIVKYVMTVESGFRNVVLLEVSERGRDERGFGMPAAICLVESARLRSVGARVGIAPRWVLDDILPDRERVEMGDTEFARKFAVYSRDPASARATVNQSLQAVLLAHELRPSSNLPGIALVPGKFALSGGGAVHKPELWLELLYLAREIEAAIR